MKEELNAPWVGKDSPSRGMLIQEKSGENLDLKINPEFEKLIPPLDMKELFILKESLWKEGCRDALVTWRGTIVDGHNRYKYCKEKGLPFKVIERDFFSEDYAIIWIIDNQMGRRNIESAAKIRLALKKEGIRSNQAKSRQGERNDLKDSVKNISIDRCGSSGKAVEFIAQDAGVGSATVERFKYIEKNAPNLADDLCAGKKVNNKKLSIDGVYRDLRKEERQEKLQKMEFPEGKYRVIYADPPWDYDSSPTAKNTATPDLKYPVMSLEDICAMPVNDIADENAVLFLWTTSYHIFQSQAVLDSWGFTYKSMFIWDKVKHNMGCYNSVRHEILLIATKGSCTPDNLELIDSVQSIERTRHSEKPEEFRKIIETLYKFGNKVELFARKQTEGWEVYGNECS